MEDVKASPTRIGKKTNVELTTYIIHRRKHTYIYIDNTVLPCHVGSRVHTAATRMGHVGSNVEIACLSSLVGEGGDWPPIA
jgi:hypothetical protein